MNDTTRGHPPTQRALLHRLRGATRAYLEICEDAKALLAEQPEVTHVHDQLVEALRHHSAMGTPRSLADAVEDAIVRMGQP